MTTRYANIDRSSTTLFPPDLRDWVPENHMVHFVIDAVEQLGASAAAVHRRGADGECHPPGMVLGLLIYSYAIGMFSSREIERASYENVAVRLLCADSHPDRELLCAFRRQNEGLLAESFAQVLELAAGCGVRKVGRIVVAIDGLRILANASKPSAATYEHSWQTMRPVELEVARLLREAEEADATALTDGLALPVDLRLRQERRTQLARAQAEMAARAFARFQAARAEEGAKIPAKEGEAAGGVEEPARFTDLERRLIKAGSGDQFQPTSGPRGSLDLDRH